MRLAPLTWLLLLTACGSGAGGAGAPDGHLPDAASDAPSADASTDAPGSDATTDGGEDAATPDATTDAPTPDADAAATGSRCTDDGFTLSCRHETRTFALGPGGLSVREVHHQVPLSAPPAAGFPVVLLFQGSLFSSELAWTGAPGAPLGALHQTRTIAALLDAGFAVVTPEAKGDGGTFWDTNIPPYDLAWETSEDHALMLAIFAAIEAGELGALDASRLYAVGISSGGYMTSRMAVSYRGRFRALAIHSASYATCAGAVCLVPATLPADHPPTLFLHGSLDAVVPQATMQLYESALRADGVATRVTVDPLAGHEWLARAPDEVTAWFEAR